MNVRNNARHEISSLHTKDCNPPIGKLRDRLAVASSFDLSMYPLHGAVAQ